MKALGARHNARDGTAWPTSGRWRPIPPSATPRPPQSPTLPILKRQKCRYPATISARGAEGFDHCPCGVPTLPPVGLAVLPIGHKMIRVTQSASAISAAFILPRVAVPYASRCRELVAKSIASLRAPTMSTGVHPTTGQQSSVAGLDIHLDRPGGGRVRDSVMEAIRVAIRSGRLVPGSRLPSSRALAADLGVARNTVARAYTELIAEGWLTSQHGSSTLVSHRAAEFVPSVAAPHRRQAPRRLDHDLRPGHPDLSSFPRAEWSRAVKRALNAAPFEAFGYTDPHGRPELRRALAEYLARARGVQARPCNIVVTSGAAEGLGLVAGALADAGVAGVAVEEFGLPSQRQSLTRAGLRCPPMTVDSAGADIGALDDMAEVGGVLLTPAHQFPLGVSLHSDRRAAVIDWARRTSGVIIEDDYDGEFRYDRSPVGALHGGGPEHVIYMGTASKSLAPGLRLGWLVLPEPLVEAVARQKGETEETCGFVDQLAMAEFIVSGSYDRHIRTMRANYRRRREELVAAVDRSSPKTTLRGMAAGLHVMLELAGGDESALSRQLPWRRLGVEGLDYYRHSEIGTERDGLVIGYASPTPSAWSAALAALIELLP
jgi:GntR family transcriptional regulator / MocR family aminotransferase